MASWRAFTGLETSARARVAAAAAKVAASRASEANRASETRASRAAFVGDTGKWGNILAKPTLGEGLQRVQL